MKYLRGPSQPSAEKQMTQLQILPNRRDKLTKCTLMNFSMFGLIPVIPTDYTSANKLTVYIKKVSNGPGKVL